MAIGKDAYESAGGDASWEAWLDICSVAGVQEQCPDLTEGLRSQISSAMTSALVRSGYSSKEFESDDPVAFFDSYFLLGSERNEAKGRKPLKRLYKFRMENEDITLKEIICGLLFSPQRGKIRDIVRDWIASVKGWCPHSVTQSDGTRKIVWESASEKDEIAATSVVEYALGLRLDSGALKIQIEEIFTEMESELKLEKAKIALLLYMTAQDLTLDNSVALEKLGIRKSRAYTLKDECMKTMAEKLEKYGVRTDDIMFATLLISSCKAILGSDFIKAIEGKGV